MKNLINKNHLKSIGIIILSLLTTFTLFAIVALSSTYFQDNGQKLIGNLIIFLFPIVLYFKIVFVNKKYNGLNRNWTRFTFKNIFKNILFGVSFGLGIMSVVLLLSKLTLGINIEFMGFKDNFTKPMFSLVMQCLVVSIWEELYFRGLVFNTLLKNKFGFHVASLISGLIFSAVHFSAYNMDQTSYFWFVGIVFIAYILAYFYVYTKSIWGPVSFHFIWNYIHYLITPEENEIGLIEVTNFVEHSKAIDNIEVICLGTILTLILLFEKRLKIKKSIKSYLESLKNETNTQLALN